MLVVELRVRKIVTTCGNVHLHTSSASLTLGPGHNRLLSVKIKISSFMFNRRSHESIEWSLYKLSSSNNQLRFEFCVRCDGVMSTQTSRFARFSRRFNFNRLSPRHEVGALPVWPATTTGSQVGHKLESSAN